MLVPVHFRITQWNNIKNTSNLFIFMLVRLRLVRQKKKSILFLVSARVVSDVARRLFSRQYFLAKPLICLRAQNQISRKTTIWLYKIINMPLISISIVCGVKTIRPFGIVACLWIDLWRTFVIRRWVILSWTRTVKSYVVAMVGTSVNGVFEAVILAEKVGDCLQFGKYFKFVLKSTNLEKTVMPNAFELMIHSAKKTPGPVEIIQNLSCIMQWLIF